MPIARDFSLDAKYRLRRGRCIPVRHPGARPAAAGPAPGRSPARPQHGHDDLRLPRLAAGRPRPHPRAQPADAGRAQRGVHLRRQRRPRRHRRLRQPAGQLLPAAQVRRRARHVVRQGPGRGPHRRHLQARQLRRHRQERRRAGARRRRSALEVLDAAHPLRGRLLRRPVPRALPGQRPGDPGHGPPGLRAVAVLRPVGRVQDRHQRRRRDRHRRGRARSREHRRPALRVGRPPVAAHAEPDAAAALRPGDGARDPLRTPGGGQGLRRRQRAEPRDARHRPRPGWGWSPPARRTTTCARRSASSASTTPRSVSTASGS